MISVLPGLVPGIPGLASSLWQMHVRFPPSLREAVGRGRATAVVS
jgi:hypothetical protein